MKKAIFTLSFAFIVCFNCVAQFGPIPYRAQLNYGVQSISKKTVNIETLRNAKSVADFVDCYPKNWIDRYTSVEISTTIGGVKKTAGSKEEILSKEQQAILNTTDLSANLYVFVHYIYKDPLSKQPESGIINYSATVVSASLVPNYEAEYAEGYTMLKQYLKEKAINKIPQKIFSNLNFVTVRFTVNESGEITMARISNSSKDITTDKLLLDAISNMPKWKPARNANGVSIKQEFQFTIGNGGC